MGQVSWKDTIISSFDIVIGFKLDRLSISTRRIGRNWKTIILGDLRNRSMVSRIINPLQSCVDFREFYDNKIKHARKHASDRDSN